ncbi:MAG: diguanylate cyclase, partial [Gammaproteobacteria bacterium]|nr:diguanylate cyclase [Gammaproteobacteria bacterium]
AVLKSVAKNTPFIRLGIRQKVLLVLMTVLFAALTASGWFALQQEKEDALKEINQRGVDISRFVAKSLAYSVVGYDYHTIQLLLEEIISSDEISFVRVTNSRGKVMSQAGVEPSDSNIIFNFQEDIRLDEDVVGKLLVSFNAESTTKRLESQKFSLVTREAFIILMIALAEFVALSYLIINPVRVISRSLDNGVDENGKIIAEIPLKTEDEFGQLARKFNELGKQLNEANYRLQAKIDLSDARLRETNTELQKQSEELQRMNEEFRLMSITDALTGLFNRRHFEELIKVEVGLTLRHKDMNSLLIIDIDHFKSVNDTYGHFTGDSVLKTVAGVLEQELRKTDVLCRVGGEEFAVLCKRASKADALMIANKLKTAINKAEIDIGTQVISTSVSIGVATIPDEIGTDTVDTFYRNADTALYYCKENGRNRCFHFDDLPPTNNQAEQLG